MSDKEIDLADIKETLTERRFWRGIVMGAIVAIIGWVVANYKTTENFILCFAAGVVIIMAFIVFVLNSLIGEERSKIIKLKKG